MKWSEISKSNCKKALINKDIDEYLKSLGFEISEPVSFCNDMSEGYEIGYYSEKKVYYSRININYNRVYFYKEYECGGYIRDFEEEITDKSVFDSIESFNEYMDGLYFD